MALLGSLTVGILGNMDNLSNTFTNAQKEVQKFAKRTQALGQSISNVGDALTRKITMPAAAAASALTGITLVKGFNRLVGIDTAQAKLKGLGHDAKSVEEIMNSALESVKGTSYGMDEAATTAASAVAAGIEPGKELTRYLSLTGDAAAIAGASMGEMGSIFNKVQTAQKAYTGELNMLADRGIPIFQWLAEEAGVTAEEVRDMASEGKISSEMFLEAIENNIGGAAKTMGEESFTAGLANIGAAISRVGANFLDAGGEGKGFFSTIKPLIGETIGFIDGLADKAADLGVKFGEAFNNMIAKIIEIKDWFMGLSEDTRSLITRIAGIGAAVVVGLGPALKIVGGLITGFGTITKIVGLLMGPVGIAIAVIGALVAAGVLLYKNWDTVKAKAVEVFGSFSPLIETVKASFQTFVGSLAPIWESLKTLFQSLLPILQQLGVVVGAVLVTAFGVLVGVFNGVVAAIGPVINAIINFVDYVVNMVNAVVALLTGDFAGAWQYLQNAGKSTVDFFVNLFTGLVNFVKGFVEGIIGFFKGLYMTLVGNSIIPDMVNAIVKWFRNMVQWVINLVRGIVNGVINLFNNLKNGVVNTFNSLRNAISNTMNKIRSTIINIWGKVMSFFRRINLRSVGRNIIQGLINGIGSMARAVVDKVKGVVNGAIEGAKRLLGIASPSKLFFQFGRFVDEGFIEGLLSMTRQVANAGEVVADAAIPSLSSVTVPSRTSGRVVSELNNTVFESGKIISLLQEIANGVREGQVIVMDERVVGRTIEPIITEFQNRNKKINNDFK